MPQPPPKTPKKTSAKDSTAAEPATRSGPRSAPGSPGANATADGDAEARQEQRIAHLDRGWELLERGDPDGARRAAEEAAALAVDEAPDVDTLLGAVAYSEGDPHEALRRYRSAMAADAEYLDPVLFAAETLLDPEVRDAKAAVRLCEQALDLAEEEEEFLDAALLHAEALIASGDEEAAGNALKELPDVLYPGSAYHLRAGHLLLDLGELDAAAAQFERALELDDASADAHHGLGAVREAQGDADGMVAEFKRTRDLDAAEPVAEDRPAAAEFEGLCRAALGELPDVVQQYLATASFHIDELPTTAMIDEGIDPRTPVLLTVAPPAEAKPKGTKVKGPVLPVLQGVHVFRRNVERLADDDDAARDEIRTGLLTEADTLLHMPEVPEAP
jgi:tetratricopeptide (TPR) repeat protein